MLKRLQDIEPVAIALDAIDMSETPAFSGIDLDTGSWVRVTFERSDAPTEPSPGNSLIAAGLVLVLSVQRFDAAA